MAASTTKFKETEIGLIPEEWGVLSLGEAVDIVDGDRGTNYPNGDDFSTGGYCLFLNTKNVPENVFDFSNLQFINREKDETLRKGKLKRGDFVLTTRGTVGNIAFYDATVTFENIRINSGMVILRNDDYNKNFNSLYLYQLLKSKIAKDQFLELTTGSAQPQLPIRDLKNLKLVRPPIDEQEEIAEILSSLDNKIELNRKINANLERLAATLFKKWFVDIGDELPEGWKVEPLDEVANFLNGLALQKYPAESEDEFLPVIKIRELNNGITNATDKASTKIPAEYILKNGDIIFSWSGSLDVVIWSSGPGALNQHLFKVTSDRYPKWFYYKWTKHFLPSFQKIASDKAVTMGHIKRSHLTESKVLVPDEKTLADMDRTMAPIIEMIINNSIEIQNLIMSRDSLLPRLMSGKIRVNI